ncbi:hypothetical protein HPB50_009106 [Hyalomma asiaticum]|uniref:Uncharacterized protein n=1 Tax=Hyalomma asiaticum TaxID=266040 RepID=A0ACB7T640_HYAAI|nr:hypothetical protein HPB50_009106 [Hyalomma asiaticum]
MAEHEPHPGRQCRSVSFDDGKRRVIATELDPEVDPLKLKPIVGRVPTPRPSLTDCVASPTSPPERHGEGSSAASQDEAVLNTELLLTRLTLECAGEADKERSADESSLRCERGEGVTEDAAAKQRAAAEMEGPMALHEPPLGRRCPSVSFDDGKRRVIATELDPEVDPLKLKPIAGRVPTPRPSLTDCVTSPKGHRKGFCAATQNEAGLNTELLLTRLTPECAGEANKELAADETSLRCERGEGATEDGAAAAKQRAADDLSSEGGSSSLTE